MNLVNWSFSLNNKATCFGIVNFCCIAPDQLLLWPLSSKIMCSDDV